jgi:hypothetical protein
MNGTKHRRKTVTQSSTMSQNNKGYDTVQFGRQFSDLRGKMALTFRVIEK